jgi:hypothetical protein
VASRCLCRSAEVRALFLDISLDSVPVVCCWKSRSCRAFFGCFLLGYFEADPVVREWDPEIAPVGVLVVFVRRVMPSLTN